MMRSLWTAASGMIGQQANIDTIANNLSNINTTGYKKVRPEFEDLIYQTIHTAGLPATEYTNVPLGVEMGHGVKIAATQRIFTQGSPTASDNATDMAIMGEGFFRVILIDGSYGYTRDGSFKIDSNRQLVTSQGYRVLPEVVLPENALRESLTVTADGQINIQVPPADEPIEIGQVQLFRFVNPAGLSAVGENAFKESAASGPAIGGQPMQLGMGQIMHKFTERANVKAADEMVNMIVAQRAYELNSKAIQTSDTMLGIANNLRR